MMDLDDLLADLQSSIPPESRQSGGSRTYDQLPELPGTETNGKHKEIFEVPPGYDAPALSDEDEQFDDNAYSTVRHGPRYIPKQQRGSPPPAKPRRTDRPEYDTTLPFRKDPEPDMGFNQKSTNQGSDSGIQELDALLSMLSDTQPQTTDPHDFGENPSITRPTVTQFINELTEVEEQVSTSPSNSTNSGEVVTHRHISRGITASTATKELDELMGKLSDFKMPPQEQPYAKPFKEPRTKSQAVSDLDLMLGSLQSNMNKQGVDTSSKGICFACDKPILGKVINALNNAWHPEHFTCAQCEVELGTITFYEHKGRAYCEKDYHELFAPRCAYCNGPILDRCMRALDKTWHPEHFFCTLCGKHFGTEGFHEKDSNAYCRECYYEKFAPRCKRCDKAILEGFISALGSQWHAECFCCKECGVTFPRGDYYDFDGEPHCEIHYHAQRGTLCAQCQKPITGKCVSAMGKKFHPDHFTCAFCLKLLNKGTFKEHRSNAYCQPCYIKLFG